MLDFTKFTEGLFWKGWGAIFSRGSFEWEVINGPNGTYIFYYDQILSSLAFFCTNLKMTSSTSIERTLGISLRCVVEQRALLRYSSAASPKDSKARTHLGLENKILHLAQITNDKSCFNQFYRFVTQFVEKCLHQPITKILN